MRTKQACFSDWLLSEIGKLDEPKAMLRLLLILSRAKKQLERQEVLDYMNNRFKVGKHATYTAIRVCVKIGLLKEELKPSKGPRPYVLHNLTDKGKKIALHIQEIEKDLR